MDSVAVFQHLHNGSRRMFLRRLLHDRLMKIGIERLALGVEARDAVTAEHIQQLRLNHRHTLNQRTRFARLLGRRDGAIQIVEGREYVKSERRLRESEGLGAVPLCALLVVLKLGLGAFGEVEVLIARLLGFRQLCLELRHVAIYGGFFRGRLLIFHLGHIVSPLQSSAMPRRAVGFIREVPTQTYSWVEGAMLSRAGPETSSGPNPAKA